MSRDVDVVVVGGRVAGASTAMLLARQGHRVLALDRAALPSDTVSTHALLRSGVLQLRRWGLLDRVVDAGTPPVRGVTLGFGDQRVSIEIRPENGIDFLMAPRRVLLDRILLDAAIDSGVVFRGSTRVVDLIQDRRGSVHGVLFEGEDGAVEPVTAHMVVGADGVWSRTAALVEAVSHKSHRPTNAVHYAYYRDVPADGFWFQFTPGVNAGIIPTNDGLCCVFAGRERSRLADFKVDPEAEFEHLLGIGGSDLLSAVREGRRVTPFRGTPGLPGFIRRPWGKGWALVGDAGYTKDPISAHGISDALRDAELCARAVDAALADPRDAEGALRAYEEQRNTLSSRMFSESAALASYRWDAEEASARMRVISDTVRDECAFLESLPAWGPVLSVA